MHALVEDAGQPAALQDEVSQKIDQSDAQPFGMKQSAELGNELLIRYSRCLSKAPCCFACIYILLFAIVIAAMWRSVVIETDFGVFIRADAEATRFQDALLLAIDKQKGVNDRRLLVPDLTATDGNATMLASSSFHQTSVYPVRPGTRRLTTAKKPFSHWLRRDLELVYQAKEGNVLDEQVLREVRDFEKSLRSIPKWQELCHERVFHTRWTWACDPGESLSPFAWASLSEPDTNIHGDDYVFEIEFDAEGKNLLPLTVLFAHMENAFANNEASRDIKRYFPDDWDMEAFLDGTGDPPATLRSRFTFYIGYAHSGWTRSQVRDEFKSVDAELEKFFQEDVYEQIQESLELREEKHVNVFYSSKFIDEHEIQLALKSDLLLAAGSVAFVSVWMWFQMKSVLLSIACFFVVFGSVPLAFVLTPAERTTLASLAPVFLITIIDIDVIFVFVNFWIQSKGTMESLHERVAWTISNAGKSCMATSLTTSVSFFANLVSAVQPLREFGLLMGLCVMAVYVLALLVLPPLMMLEYRFTNWREERQQAHQAMYEEGLSSAEAGFSIVPAAPTVVDHSSGGADSPPSLPKLPSPHDLSDVSLAPVERQVSPTASGASPDLKENLSNNPTSDLSSSPRKNKKKSRFLHNPQTERSVSYKCLFALVELISRCACQVLLMTLVTVPIFIWGVVANIELDLDKPKLFPPEHNQNMVKLLLEDFATASELRPSKLPQASGVACNATRFSGFGLNSEMCLFDWCDKDEYDLTVWNKSTAKCHRSQTTVRRNGSWTSVGLGLAPCMKVTLRHRYASAGFELLDVSLYEVWNKILNGAANQTIPEGAKMWQGSSKIGSLALESWEAGTVQTEDLGMTEVVVDLPQNALLFQASENCYLDTMCFANMPGCSMGSGWTNLGNFHIQSPVGSNRRLSTDRGSPSPERRLAVSCQGCSLVHVVWGIAAPMTSPVVGAPEWKWRFDQRFELSNPWAQRAVYNACQSAKAAKQLYIKKRTCWIESFKNWLHHRKRDRFPSRTFDQDVIQWFQQSASWEEKKQVWFENGKVVACQIELYPSIPKTMSSSGVMENKDLWNEWLWSLNSDSSITANRAWHVSQRWVSAEANEVVINSTMLTIFIELLVGGMCILIFTGDPILAVIVLSLVVINIGGLAFFMVAVFKWLIGPIEVICLVVFVGYSVTFGLHISGDYARVQEDDPDLVAHYRLSQDIRRHGLMRFWKAFSLNRVHDDRSQRGHNGDEFDVSIDVQKLTEREKRLGRTRIAMLHVGGAIISAAFSSAGTSIFLMMCTLTIFNKIGVVVLTITVLSVIVTLISLPAALMIFGPGFHPCYKRCFRACGS